MRKNLVVIYEFNVFENLGFLNFIESFNELRYK